jgi:hypothetical protein
MKLSHRTLLTLARLLWLVIVAVSVVLHLVYLQAHLNTLESSRASLTQIGVSAEVARWLTFAFEMGWALFFYGVSAYLVVKRPHSAMVWLVSAAGFMMPVRVGFMQVVPLDSLPMGFPPLVQSVFLATFATLTYWVFAVFPDGRFVPSWVRWWVLLRFPIMTNYVIDLIPAVNRVYVWIDIVMFGALALAQYRRFRTERTPIQRQQTKWVLLGMSVGLDTMGHAKGGHSEEYADQVIVQDQCLATFVPQALALGYDVIVTGDHGMTEQGNHNGTLPEARRVPLYMIWADGNGRGDTFEEKSQLSLAPTILSLLEVPVPDTMKAAEILS